MHSAGAAWLESLLCPSRKQAEQIGVMGAGPGCCSAGELQHSRPPGLSAPGMGRIASSPLGDIAGEGDGAQSKWRLSGRRLLGLDQADVPETPHCRTNCREMTPSIRNFDSGQTPPLPVGATGARAMGQVAGAASGCRATRSSRCTQTARGATQAMGCWASGLIPSSRRQRLPLRKKATSTAFAFGFPGTFW